jgi:outer membrane protein W
MLTCGGSSLLLAAGEQRFRVEISHVSSGSELLNLGVELGAENAFGGRLSFEHLWSERFGLEIGLATSSHDYTIAIFNGVPRTVEFRLTPLTIAGNLHFGGTNRIDNFAGVGVAYVTVGDFSERGSTTTLPVDAEFTWMAQYGMDISLKEPWSLGLAISYFDVDVRPGALQLNVEAVSIFVGVVWRRK